VILQRIAKNLLSRDWGEALVEVVIVILGIFIALQVDQWKTNYDNKQTEISYLQRLHSELHSRIEEKDAQVKNIENRVERLVKVAEYLSGSNDSIQLEPNDCGYITRIHITADYIESPNAIKELLLSGNIMLISDSKLRDRVINFDSEILSSKQLRHDIQSDRILLSRRYPEIISLGDSWSETTCDYGAMLNNSAFKNDFFDSYFRYQGYTSNVIFAQHERTKELFDLVDTYLAEHTSN